MEVILYDTHMDESAIGIINKSSSLALPSNKEDWQFNWKSLAQTQGAEFYKLVLQDAQEAIQGLLMISLMYEELIYMHNIEVAPHNLGSQGRYNHVAGSLLAYASLQAYERGENKYKGFLAFTSKTELIDYYCKQYGATHAMGHQMYFDRKATSKLINKYIYPNGKR